MNPDRLDPDEESVIKMKLFGEMCRTQEWGDNYEEFLRICGERAKRNEEIMMEVLGIK